MSWTLGKSAIAAAVMAMGLLAGSTANAQVLFRPTMPNPVLIQQQGLQLAGDALRLAQFGQIDAAISRIQLASQLTPGNPDILTVLGRLHLQQGEFAEAITVLNSARDLAPDSPDILLSLGSAHVRQGSYFAALESLERGLELDPENLGGLFDLGNTHLLLENYDLARSAYGESLELEPEFWPSINNIGLLEYQQGNIEAAISQFEASIEIDDSVAEPKLALATALYVEGETERALELGIEAMQLDFTYGDIQTLRENLWGDVLIRDVQVLLNTEEVSAALDRARADRQLQDLDSGTF